MATKKAEATKTSDLDLSYDLKITQVTRRTSGGGAWVCGTVYGYRFEALVFAEHAEIDEYELGDSRISKLWVQRIADGETVFNWDRGADVNAADATIQAIVDFLSAGLADYVYTN